MRIGISGFQGTDVHKPGAAVARCLRDDGRFSDEIIALESYPVTASLSLATAAKEVRYFPSTGNEVESIRGLLCPSDASLRIDLFIPCDDMEVVATAQLASEFRDAGVRAIVPSLEAVLCTQKAMLSDCLASAGIPTPRMWRMAERTDHCAENHRVCQFPVVCKGPVCDAYLASTQEELDVYVDRIRSIWGDPVLLQEFISGDEYAVTGLAGEDSEVLGCVAIRKLGITEKGKTWCGVTVSEPSLRSLLEQIVKTFSWVGPIEIEAIKDSRTGQFTIIEINPRFPAWIYLAHKAGQNLPLLLVELAGGGRVSPLHEYRTGLVLMRTFQDETFPIHRIGQLLTEARVVL